MMHHESDKRKFNDLVIIVYGLMKNCHFYLIYERRLGWLTKEKQKVKNVGILDHIKHSVLE